MAAGPTPNLLFFLFMVRAWAQEDPPLEVLGAVGGAAYLNPTLPKALEYSQVHWRHKDQRKIAIEKRGEPVEYPESPYKERLELFPNHTLKICPLRKEDSSEYRLYLEDDSGKESVKRVLLRVLDVVPKPLVTAEVTGADPQRCNATLTCSVALDGVTYEWIPPLRGLLREEGAVQRVSFNPLEETYVCKVSNAVSSSYASLTYRHPCTWTGESSSAASGPTPGALVALGHLLLLLLLLTVA